MPFYNQLVDFTLQLTYYTCHGPDYAEKRRRMAPGGRFCLSDNAPQDGDSAGAAGAAHSRRQPWKHLWNKCHQGCPPRVNLGSPTMDTTIQQSTFIPL